MIWYILTLLLGLLIGFGIGRITTNSNKPDSDTIARSSWKFDEFN